MEPAGMLRFSGTRTAARSLRATVALCVAAIGSSHAARYMFCVASRLRRAAAPVQGADTHDARVWALVTYVRAESPAQTQPPRQRPSKKC
jgi:hypothetical protein